MIATGAGLVALSTILPWISVALLGSLNLFDVYRVDGQQPVIPAGVALTSLLVAVLALAGKSAAGPFAFVVGLIFALGGTLYLIGIIDAVRQADGLAGVGVGPWVAVLGIV